MKNSMILVLVLGATAVASADIYGPGAGGSIPDFAASTPGVFTSTINVGSDVSAVNNITIRGLDHTWAGDLIISVSNGNGSVDLVRRLGSSTLTGVGDSSVFNGDYVFAVGGANLQSAAAGVGFGITIPGGTYSPSTNIFDGVSAASSHVFTNYSALTGAGSSGVWTLTISDNAGGDVGSLTDWTIDAEAVPEPATMTVLGLAALAAARRRKQK